MLIPVLAIEVIVQIFFYPKKYNLLLNKKKIQIVFRTAQISC
jgi:hypothetical protein